MYLSEFTLRIILLFIPGIICFRVIDRLTIHKELRIHQILINSLLLGFLCYLIYYLLIPTIKFCLRIELQASFFKALTNKNDELSFEEIALVTALSVPIGFIFAYFTNHKMLHRFARMLKVTKKFGDVDVWSYIMNSKVPEWVVIRDMQNDLMYEGWVQVFSDSTEEDELFLRDVKVYKNSTAQPMYESPGLYLPRKRENLVVEFPLLEFSKYHERPKGEEGKKNG